MWLDKEEFIDRNIGHSWILISNKMLSREIHDNWMIQVLKERDSIIREMRKNGQ